MVQKFVVVLVALLVGATSGLAQDYSQYAVSCSFSRGAGQQILGATSGVSGPLRKITSVRKVYGGTVRTVYQTPSISLSHPRVGRVRVQAKVIVPTLLSHPEVEVQTSIRGGFVSGAGAKVRSFAGSVQRQTVAATDTITVSVGRQVGAKASSARGVRCTVSIS